MSQTRVFAGAAIESDEPVATTFRTSHRTGRVLSGLLLVNIFAFWLAACVKAFG